MKARLDYGKTPIAAGDLDTAERELRLVTHDLYTVDNWTVFALFKLAKVLFELGRGTEVRILLHSVRPGTQHSWPIRPSIRSSSMRK